MWFTAVPENNENPNFSFRRAQKGNHPLTLRQEAAGRDPHSAECVTAELHPVWDFGCVSFLVARRKKTRFSLFTGTAVRLFLRDGKYFAWLLIGLGGMMGISVAGDASCIRWCSKRGGVI